MMTGNLLGSLIVLGLAGRTYGLCDSDTVRGYTKMGSGGICSGSAPSHPSTKKKELIWTVTLFENTGGE